MMGAEPDPNCAEAADEIERLTGLLAEWENHAGPYKEDEIERLTAALKEAAMLVEATARYYPSIPYKPRLDACLLEARRALEPKP